MATGAAVGLTPSPAGALAINTDGYVDYVDAHGCALGGGQVPPPGTTHIRRWAIAPTDASPDTLVLQVVVTRRGIRTSAPGGGTVRSHARRSEDREPQDAKGAVSHGVRVRAAEAVGFSLLELLIATMVLLVVTGGALRLISPAGNAFAAQPEAADLQQRLRVGVDALRRELLMAGAGTYTGSPVGPLVYQFAPILPHAVGTLVPGSPDHPDAAVITLMYVPSTPAQTTTQHGPDE